ncbi:TPA: hypothetical protein ACIPUI_000378 [Citrobacter freundii]
MKIIYLIFFIPLFSFAKENTCSPDNSDCENSVKGKLEIRYDEHTDKNHSFIYLNNRPFVKVETDSMMFYNGIANIPDMDKKSYRVKKIMVTYRDNDPCFCDKYFIVDLTGIKPTFSNAIEGPSDLTWISWGKKNSVISFNGALFQYENGIIKPMDEKNKAK